MLGTYVVGTDIHTEIFSTNRIINYGWDYTLADGNNMSAVLFFVSPLLNKIGFPLVWQFKILYPLIFSFTPVLLYLAYCKILDNRSSFFAALFSVIIPMFVLDTTSTVKSLIAETFLAGLILVLLSEMSTFKKSLLGLICVIGSVLNHYTVGFIMLFYLVGMLVVSVISKWSFKFKGVKSLSIITVSSILIVVLWFGLVGQGAMLNMVTAIGNNILKISHVAEIPQGNSTQEIETLEALYDERTQPIEVTGTYLDNQEQLTRTALGLDFMDTDLGGKLFRVVQLITQLLIALGVVYVIVKRKELSVIYVAGVVTSFLILIACLFVPMFSTIVSTTRFYQLALFILAPCLVFSLKWILPKRYVTVLACVMVAYYLFTSGFIFEVTKSQADKVNTPYSIPLSNYRSNIAGVFSEDDINAARWVSNNHGDLPILTDYNSRCLLLGIDPMYDMPVNETEYYIFVTSWSTEHDKLVYGRSPGLRHFEPIPQGKEVHRSGNALVLIKDGNDAGRN
jgi:uncharacterized membrane protein